MGDILSWVILYSEGAGEQRAKRQRKNVLFSIERPIMFLMFGYNAGFIAAGGLFEITKR